MWVWLRHTNTSAWITADIFQRICLFRDMPTPSFIHCLSSFMPHFGALWAPFMLKQPQSILLSARTPCEWNLTAANPPSSKTKTTWQLVLQRNCASHFSDMAFEGISSWLSLARMLFFQLSYQCGGWPSEPCDGRGSHQNKLQAAALVKEVLLVVVTGVCDSLSISLIHTHRHTASASHKALKTTVITVWKAGTDYM